MNICFNKIFDSIAIMFVIHKCDGLLYIFDLLLTRNRVVFFYFVQITAGDWTCEKSMDMICAVNDGN